MINWATVAAYIGPLLVAIGGVAGLFSRQAKQREARIGERISAATASIEAENRLTQQRLAQVETLIEANTRHLDKQDDALLVAMQAIARIEGRLAGPVVAP